MIFPLVVIACCLSSCVLASQYILSESSGSIDALHNSTAAFIFNSLSSLLLQWPNTYHANGHTIVAGTLAPFTLLYHANKQALFPPSSPEWFAFQPEMSFGIMAPHVGDTFLLTYTTVRPVKIIYFDGMSGAVSNETGWLDSQEVLVKDRAGPPDDYPPPWNEWSRARKLCDWSEELGVEGFVRMNSGFELIWCNFDSPSIQLVSHLNVTPPGTPPAGPSDRPTGNWSTSPFAVTGHSEWLRAAAQRGTSPLPQITLNYASFVTFYHPRLRSLAPARVGQLMREHRVRPYISDADARSVREEVESAVLRPWEAASGVDWAVLAWGIIEAWAGRVAQLHELLRNTSVAHDEDTVNNTTEALIAVRRLAYSALSPYMDMRYSTNSTPRDWVFGSKSNNVGVSEPALSRCQYSATGHLRHAHAYMYKQPQEEILQTSLETVLERLCTDYGVVFVESMEADDRVPREAAREMIRQWETRIDDLMKWLDWTAWLRCDEVCSLDSVCAMAMWPLKLFERRTDDRSMPDWKPRCVSLVSDDLTTPGGLGFALSSPKG